jgi:hypothetical protein
VLLIFAYLRRWFKKPLYVTVCPFFFLLFWVDTPISSSHVYVQDAVIVGFSLVIELYLEEELKVAEIIILFRLWRLLRIMHGVYVAMHEGTPLYHRLYSFSSADRMQPTTTL